MIQIYRNNQPFFALEDVCDGSKMSRQLMDHHYIVLKFSTEEPVYFEIGDSVEIADFGLFVLTSAYFPKYNETTDGYDYELQMDAYYMSWKNKICKYRPQYGANETSFKLTTSVSVHLNVVLSNLKALNYKYHNKDFSVDYTTYNKEVFDTEKRFLVEYSSISIIEALNTICETLDCEWWVDGSIIYLGYCEMNGQTTFEQGVNMLSMSQSESKSSFITRLYAFGSDKNIPSGYFSGADADVTTDGIATDYLMLPNKDVDEEGYYSKDGYIENVNVVKNDSQAIEGVVKFEDEYPKVSCVVSAIKTYESTVDNEDGTKNTATFWQVTSNDSFATNFETSWIKKGLNLMIRFDSGALTGMEFGVSFKIIDKAKYFEIVANDTYGRTLPDSVMCPKIRDKFHLYNWDASKITETPLISDAQEALYARAKNYYKKSMVDNSNFTCVLDSEKFFNNGTYNYHPLGEQVKLINPLFSDTDKDGKHYRNSRIIGIEIKLDIPYDSPTYIVGEKAAYSRLSQLEDKVNSITVNGLQIGGASGGGGVYIIGMNDTTPETDSNVYSARRTRNSFLSKLHPDTAQKVITFIEGLKLGDGEKGIDAKGNAVLGDVVLDRVHDPRSTEQDRVIVGAQGFDLYMGADGKSHMYIDYLTARVKAFFPQLEIRKVSYSGGTTIFSNAGSTIVKVAYIFNAQGTKVIAYKCYAAADDGTTKTMNWWHVGMMALCQTFNVKAGESDNLANRYFWRLVVGVGQEILEDGKLYDYVMLSNMSTFVGGDNVVPSYCSKVLAKKKAALKWGNIAVLVAQQNGMISMASLFAEQEGGRTQDDGKNEIASRVFYGYDEGSLAPLAGDVIVNVGDQIRWNSRGNVIKLTTSTEDNSSDTAPSITMYHGIGALWETGKVDADKQPVRNPYQWKTVTCVISPELTMFNTERFKWFSGTPDNLIDPITVMWEIVPTSSSIVRHVNNRTTTPSDITFTLVKHTGSKAETIAIENVVFKATIEYQNGNKLNNAPFVNLATLASLYDMKSVKVDAYLKEEVKGTDGQTETKQTLVKSTNIIVTSDGKEGSSGRGIVSVNTFYALGDNPLTSPVNTEYKYDTLSTVVIKANADKYVWSADKVTYSNKTVELTGKYCVGKCADLTSVTEMYGVSNSATVIPKVWIYSYPTTEQLTPGTYIWSRDEIVWLDGTKEYSEAQLVGYVGKDGDKGEPGNPGDPGKPGKPGTDGQDAIQVDFLPTALTVEANSDSSGNAVVDCSSGNIMAEILVRSGSKSVMSACDKIEIASVDGCTAEVVRTDVNIAKVRINSVSYTTVEGKRISYTTASVTVRVHCLLTNLYYSATLAINVNVAALWGEYKRDMKSMESKYTEISNATNKRVDDLGDSVDNIGDKVIDIDKALDGIPIKTDTDLTKYTSKIEQSARNISLKVGETVVGRHNLLTGSAFERKTDFWQGNDSYMPYISVLNNYKGYNSAVIEGKSGTNRGVDFILVKVNAARKNVVSAMLKCSGTVSDREFYAYILQRDGSMADLKKNLSIPFKVAKNMIANEWMLAAETLTLDANTAYIDCVFLYYGTKTAYIACPQIAEGDEYTGYTLSEQDRGYIGGNLLINTDTLVKPDSLSIYNSDPLVVDSTHTSLLQEGDANKYGSYATLYTDATSAEVNTIRWNLKGMNLIKQGQMYMLSFVAKGTGKVCAFLYNDGTPLVSTEASGFTSSNQSSDGNALITLTSSWQRYFVFWRVVGDKLPIYVLFRAMKGSKLYLSQPKLEYGATVTEYRAKKTDYIEDKSIAGSLLDAGIDINSKEITLTADKTTFRTTKGTKVAMFDEDGLNAQLVRAQRLQTKGKNGLEVRIEDGMVQIFGAAGVANIRFGLDDNGYATLGYYDNHGNLMYDLGPKGIVKLDVADSTMTRTAFINLDAAGLVSPYTEKKDGYLWITADNNNKFFGLQGKPNVYVRVNLGVSKSVELYLYRAPRVNGEVILDEKYRLSKSQAEKADGCYFTSNQVQVTDGNFTNLAKGTYLPWDAQTRDNTKLRPIGVKSVPKLSVGGYMTLDTSALASTSQLKVLSTVYGGGVYVFPDNGFGNVEID